MAGRILLCSVLVVLGSISVQPHPQCAHLGEQLPPNVPDAATIRPQEPLVAGDGVKVAVHGPQVNRALPGGLSAIEHHQGSPGVGQVADGPGREAKAALVG